VFVTGEWAEALRLPPDGGLLVQGVARGSAADRAGVRGPQQWVIVGNAEIGIGGDLIMAIDGNPCDRPDAITRLIARKRPGDVVELTLFRGGRTVRVPVTLGEAPEERF
jgi:S1-C subfamily serine protease